MSKICFRPGRCSKAFFTLLIMFLVTSVGEAKKNSNEKAVPTLTSSVVDGNSTKTLLMWRLGDKLYPMRHEASTGIIISYNCFPLDTKIADSKCSAAQALKELKFPELPSGALVGGKNPGSLICKEGLKSSVVILKDSDGNENSFCEFKDGSLVSNSTLIRFAK
jgi:putative hemolysin